MLACEGLTLWRGANCLFESLGCVVPAGSALVVEGPNGAGKTTLLRVIAGLTRPESGSVAWNGMGLQAQVLAGRLRLAFAGHSLALKPELTTRQNLRFFASLSGLETRVEPILEAMGLGSCAELEVRLLSAGQKRRAALGRVLLARADLWLLDEPQTNLDMAGRQLLEESVRKFLGNGGTLVVAAHQSLDLGTAAITRLRLGEG